MRLTMRLSLILAMAAVSGGCGKEPGARAPLVASTAASAATISRATPVRLTAADGVTVFATLYAVKDPKAVILLFHQAGSGKGEYATIAPKLVAMGYSALAIDQRSGGNLFGRNETAAALGREASYLDAKADLQAALDWATPQGKPVILWGSSYSSALVFLVAAENPGKVAGVMSFSPGEYLGGPHVVRDAAARVTVPVYVTSAKDSGEIAAARAIVAAVATSDKVQFLPGIAGVHGSSTLIADRNPRGAEQNWQAVSVFLLQVAP